MPRSQVDIIAVLPRGSELSLIKRLGAAAPRDRSDLRSSTNIDGGSGGNYGVFAEIGEEFLKASLQKRFLSPQEAEGELVEEFERLDLGIYHPLRSWFLSRGRDGAYWACSLTPKLPILRDLFNRADGSRYRVWELYLKALRMAFRVAARSGRVLDCNPNNFGVQGNRLFYVDDESFGAKGKGALGIQALLRLREYPGDPIQAREAFLDGLATSIEEYPPAVVARWGLDADLENRILWPKERVLQQHLLRLLDYARKANNG